MSNAKNHSQERHSPEKKGTERVRAFLSAMEARDLASAERYLAANVVMQFPGTPPMQRLSEVVDWAQTRYRRVSKTFHAVDQCDYPNHCAGSVIVVFCHGDLTVEWLEGGTSTGVRFIDRFEITDGLITRQDVWNDLALEQIADANA